MSEPSPELVELEPQPAIAVRGEVAIADMPRFFEQAFHAAWNAAESAGVEIVGPPFGYYPEMPGETVVIEAGFPVSKPMEAVDDVHPLELPGGRAVHVVHVGPFETMEQTYAELDVWMKDQDLHPATGMWESYLSDPATEPDPAKWRTRIIWPVS